MTTQLNPDLDPSTEVERDMLALAEAVGVLSIIGAEDTPKDPVEVALDEDLKTVALSLPRTIPQSGKEGMTRLEAAAYRARRRPAVEAALASQTV